MRRITARWWPTGVVGLGAVALLGRRVSWVDSSVDPEARATARSKNAGDHTTPTVMFGNDTRTNPEVGWVRALLR